MKTNRYCDIKQNELAKWRDRLFREVAKLDKIEQEANQAGDYDRADRSTRRKNACKDITETVLALMIKNANEPAI